MGSLISCPKHPQFMLAESFSSDEGGQNSIDEFVTKCNDHIRPNIAQMWVTKGLDHAFEWVDPEELKMYTKERKQSLKEKKRQEEADPRRRAEEVALTTGVLETKVEPRQIPVSAYLEGGRGPTELTRRKPRRVKRDKSPAAVHRNKKIPFHKRKQKVSGGERDSDSDRTPRSRLRPATAASGAVPHRKKIRSKKRTCSTSPHHHHRRIVTTSTDTHPWAFSP